jgi:hypothetical protein
MPCPLQIIHVNLTSAEPVAVKEGQKVTFTFAVTWQSSTTPFTQRFERYLDYNFFEHKASSAREQQCSRSRSSSRTAAMHPFGHSSEVRLAGDCSTGSKHCKAAGSARQLLKVICWFWLSWWNKAGGCCADVAARRSTGSPSSTAS